MPVLEKTVSIDASPESVFARFDDPTNFLEDAANAVEVTDVVGEGVGKTYKMVYATVGVKVPMTFTVTSYAPNKVFVAEFKGGMTGTLSMRFEPDGGGTRFSITIDYSIPIPLVGKIAEALLAKRNEREWDVILANVKDALEAG